MRRVRRKCAPRRFFGVGIVTERELGRGEVRPDFGRLRREPRRLLERGDCGFAPIDGFEREREIGPGIRQAGIDADRGADPRNRFGMLAGLMQRIRKGVNVISVSDSASVQACAEKLKLA